MRGAFTISNHPSDADVERIHRFLAEEAYWSKGIAIESLRKGSPTPCASSATSTANSPLSAVSSPT